jgi:predicted MPP superfamily phosphohydrolase
MSIFLITFITLYGGMHIYAFFRLSQAFTLQQTTTTLLIVWMTLMVFAPLLVRLAENANLERTAQFVAWPAYIWMGGIFIFCATLVAADTLRFVAWSAKQFYRVDIPSFLTAAITCKIALFIALLASAYSLYEARTIRTDHLTVTTAKLPPESTGIRIIQVSDVHLGLLFRESRLESVLQAVMAAHPDILVSTGDLVDGRLSRENATSSLNRMADMIASVPTKLGKFAVTGNHEYYAGLGQAVAFTRKAGFTVLRNQSITLPVGITISGVDDPAGQRIGLTEPNPTEAELLQSVPSQNFHLLLKHRPIILPVSDGLFDLQLSGHVHKGQIFPFNLLVRLKFPIPCGDTITRHNSMIHVSRGSGTWGPPMRLLASPEITIIDIVPALPATHR